MPITKNPFGYHSHGKAETEKPDTAESLRAKLTSKPSRANAEADSSPQKSVGVSAEGSLPPTRKANPKGKKVPSRTAAGFQKTNPFHKPTYAKVSNTGSPKERKEEQVSWDPKKLPPAPGAPAQATPPAAGAPTQAKPPTVGASVIATTAKGLETVTPNSSSDNYDKTYARTLDAAHAALVEKAAQKVVTAENYREVYQAQQQQRATEQRGAHEKQRSADDPAARQKRLDNAAARQKQLDQAAAHANKGRELQAKMANLRMKLVPNMSPEESHRIHGQLEELRVALAQIPYYG